VPSVSPPELLNQESTSLQLPAVDAEALLSAGRASASSGSAPAPATVGEKREDTESTPCAPARKKCKKRTKQKCATSSSQPAAQKPLADQFVPAEQQQAQHSTSKLPPSPLHEKAAAQGAFACLQSEPPLESAKGSTISTLKSGERLTPRGVALGTGKHRAADRAADSDCEIISVKLVRPRHAVPAAGRSQAREAQARAQSSGTSASGPGPTGSSSTDQAAPAMATTPQPEKASTDDGAKEALSKRVLEMKKHMLRLQLGIKAHELELLRAKARVISHREQPGVRSKFHDKLRLAVQSHQAKIREQRDQLEALMSKRRHVSAAPLELQNA